MERTMDDSTTSLVVRNGPEDGQKMKNEFTEDDTLEILARLPVKSLLRFKSVSKRWYSLILSPHFISTHSKHSHRKKKVSLLFYSCNTTVAGPPTTAVSIGFGDVRERLTFSGKKEDVEIVGCFQGVVCLSLSKCPQKYALWNPATRQVREIGGAPMNGPATSYVLVNEIRWYGSGFCFDPVTNAFKVNQLKFINTDAGEIRAQVNVFSTATNSWTEKNIAVPYQFRRNGFNFNHRCNTFVNGFMHWHVATGRYGNTSRDGIITVRSNVEDMYILSYNMTDDVFQRIEMPCPPVLVYYHLAAYKGSLAMFVHKGPDEVDVWVLNDCGGANQSWSKLVTCRPSIEVRFAAGFFRKDNVDMVLLCEEWDGSLYLYDTENGETEEFLKEDSGTDTFLYSETLASLN